MKLSCLIKIKINSPLVKINKPETTEKKIIFFRVCLCITKNKNCKNKSEKKICKVVDEICPAA